MNDVTSIISRSESAALHAGLLRERPHELAAFTRARLELGLRVPAYDYLQALRLRARLARAFSREVWAEVDVLAAPVIPGARAAARRRARRARWRTSSCGRAASPGSRAPSTASACPR